MLDLKAFFLYINLIMRIKNSLLFEKKTFELRKGILKLAQMTGGAGAHMGAPYHALKF